MIIRLIDEFSKNGHLIYAENLIGAFMRGKTRDEALTKLPLEVKRYCLWLGMDIPAQTELLIVQEKPSELQICDADSDILFDSERLPLTMEEYLALKTLALRSAKDFLALYESIPDKTGTVLSPRKTFYGEVPITAQEMYNHTKSVNSYYFGEIDIDADNEVDILACRERGFAALEAMPDFLNNPVIDGSYDEQWSLRKVCRRFVWHDRIHAKAMHKMASSLCGAENIADPFFFGIK